jgi:hypothetical protein
MFGFIKHTLLELLEEEAAANAAAAVRNRKFPAVIANFTDSDVKTDAA